MTAEPKPTTSEPASGVPPSLDTVRAAVQVQATDALQRRAFRYARTRAALVRHAGGRPDRLYIRELVQDALADTWTGDLKWNPERCTLLDHVCGAIRRRTSDDAERARRYPHRPIEAVLANGNDPARDELESFLGRLNGSDVGDLATLVADVIAELRALAPAADAAVIAILDAWADGIGKPADVMRRGRLPGPVYRAARGRIERLVPELPAELRGVVVAVLRRAS